MSVLLGMMQCAYERPEHYQIRCRGSIRLRPGYGGRLSATSGMSRADCTSQRGLTDRDTAAGSMTHPCPDDSRERRDRSSARHHDGSPRRLCERTVLTARRRTSSAATLPSPPRHMTAGGSARGWFSRSASQWRGSPQLRAARIEAHVVATIGFGLRLCGDRLDPNGQALG